MIASKQIGEENVLKKPEVQPCVSQEYPKRDWDAISQGMRTLVQYHEKRLLTLFRESPLAAELLWVWRCTTDEVRCAFGCGCDCR